MITKEHFEKLSYNELNKIATYPRPTSFKVFKEAKTRHLCCTCGEHIESGEMYTLIKRVFGDDCEKHHIVCPEKVV